jgi:hypothetical protein
MASPFDHSTEMPFLPFWRIGAGAAFHAVFFSRLAGLKSSLPAFLLQSSDLVTRSPVTKSGDNSSPDERTVAILPAGREEARFLHQPVVELVGRVDPLGVLLARQEGVVEGTLLHELLPVVGRHHLLEKIGIEGDLLGLAA